MAEMKTKQTDASVDAFLRAVSDPKQREEAIQLTKLLRKITGTAPKMWGSSIVGFGTYHYRYPSGREGEWFLTGLSPRKGYLMISIMCGFDQHRALLKKLGKFKTGKSCLYVKRLQDIDLPTLGELVKLSVAQMIAMEKQSAKS